jgi:hypothetical protein
MTPRPQARAANAKAFLAFLEGLHPGTTAHLRATLPPEVMEAVEGSARTDWNSLALDGQYVAAIVACLGAEQACAAWRRFAYQEFIRTPAIRAIFDGTRRVFGLSVGALLKVMPLAFHQGFRDFGEMRVTIGERDATAEIAELAPEVVRHGEAYGVLFHGMFLGIYDMVQAEPRLDYRVELEARRLVAHFRW